MRLHQFLKANKYARMLAWSKFDEIDALLANENDIKTKMYVSYKRYEATRDFEKCYRSLVDALNNGFFFEENIRSMIRDFLNKEIRSKNYENAKTCSTELLRFSIVPRQWRSELYQILGVSLYYLKDHKTLAEIVEKLAAVEGMPDHPLIEWANQPNEAQ